MGWRPTGLRMTPEGAKEDFPCLLAGRTKSCAWHSLCRDGRPLRTAVAKWRACLNSPVHCTPCQGTGLHKTGSSNRISIMIHLEGPPPVKLTWRSQRLQWWPRTLRSRRWSCPAKLRLPATESLPRPHIPLPYRLAERQMVQNLHIP